MFLALDIDHFPAQAVGAYDPVRRSRPFVVVRQNPDHHKCVAWACSARARERHIRRGQPVVQLRKRHPDLVVLPRDEALEEAAREELGWLAEQITPDYDIGESGRGLLDLSGTPAAREHAPEDIARDLQRDIARCIGIRDVAAGIASSRLIAGMLARLARPRGIRVCPPGEESETLASLGAHLLPVSGRVREKMRQYGVRQVGQIQRLGKEALVVRLGAEGERLYSLSVGLDPKKRVGKKKAIEAETVLDRDINDERLLRQHVRYTADKLGHALESARARAGTCTFVLTYTDGRTAQRTVAFQSPTDALDLLAPAAERLFRELYRRRVAVRSFRLVVPQPRRDTGQLDLFESSRDRRRRALGNAVANIRQRMGFRAVVRGSNFEAVRAVEEEDDGGSPGATPADFLDDAHPRE